MSNAPRDENNVPTILACLNTDTIQGETLVPVQITSAGLIKVNYTDTISFTMQPIDPKDENYVNCWLFKGSNGLTYPAVANADGELLMEP